MVSFHKNRTNSVDSAAAGKDAKEHHHVSGLFHKLRNKSSATNSSSPASSGRVPPLRAATVSSTNGSHAVPAATRHRGATTSAPVGKAKSSSPAAIPKATARTTNSSVASSRDRSVARASTAIGHSAITKHRSATSGSSASSSSSSNPSTPKFGLPSIDDYRPKNHKMTYNPFGLNNNLNGSRAATQTSKFSFDDADVNNILPYPVDLPNTHLPPELQEESQDLFEEYQFTDKAATIGTGASATVKKVSRIGHPREVYALKKFVLFKDEKPDEFYKRASAEYILQHNLNAGLHIATVHALVKIPHQQNIQRGWGLIMEICKADLFDIISRPGFSHSSHAEKMCLFKQIVYGVRYMHECDIAHRDLKPENVLLTQDGVVKLTDFGVACYGHKVPGDFTSGIVLSTQLVGSPPYQPPEVEAIKGVSNDLRVAYNPFQMDMWALGVILYVLFYGTIPFESADDHSGGYRDYTNSLDEYVKKNTRFRTSDAKGPGIEYRFARKFRDPGTARICWRLLEPKPAKRYTMADLFADKSFQSAEMCIAENDYACTYCHRPCCYEEEFKFPYGETFDAPGAGSAGHHSFSSSSSSIYGGRSRSGTTSSMSNLSTPVTPMPKVKSMLDIAEDAERKQGIVPPATPGASPAASDSLDELPEVDENSSSEDEPLTATGTAATARTISDEANDRPLPTTAKTDATLQKDDQDTLSGDEEEKGVDDDRSDSNSDSHSATEEDELETEKEDNAPADGSAADIPDAGAVAADANATDPSTDGTATAADKNDLLDCLCTNDGPKNINLADDRSAKINLVSKDDIYKCGCCKVKAHAHIPRW